MPRFSFRITKTESIEWGFNRHPRIGEEVTLGDRGVFRVLESSQDPVDPTVDAEYLVEKVRDSTHDDVQRQLKVGVNRLP